MSNESIISKTQLINNQSYGSTLSKETTDAHPRPKPRLSHRRRHRNSNITQSTDEQDSNDDVTDNNNCSPVDVTGLGNRHLSNQESSDYQQQQQHHHQTIMDKQQIGKKNLIITSSRNKSSEENNKLIQQPLTQFFINRQQSDDNDSDPISTTTTLDGNKLQQQQQQHSKHFNNRKKKHILMDHAQSNGHHLTDDPESASAKERPYPKYVFFIIGNEFCERFSFYGLRAILVLYFRDVLGFSDSNSTISFHLFMTLCYFTPIFGAVLGDSILGKYRTILYLSSVYFIGELLLVISSVIWNNHALSVGLTMLSLILIGGGTGGIKPCVSALSGDQFLSSEQQRIQNFFSMFYFSINAGSLISTFLTPVLRNDVRCLGRSDCFPLAFGVPCILMFVGLILFVVARSKYTIVPLPKDNVLVSFVKSIYHALKNKWSRSRSRRASKNRPRNRDEPGSSDASTLTVNTLPPPAPSSSLSSSSSSDNSSQKDVDIRELERSHWIYYALDRYDKKTLDEFRSVLAVLVLFLPLPVFWCLFDQQSSRWTLQATRMDGNIFGFNLKPDQIQVANPLLVLSLIPIFDLFVYPIFNKFGIIKTPLQRMTAGGILAGLTFYTSALIEKRIDYYSPVSEVPHGQGHLSITNGLGNCELVYPAFFANTNWNEENLSLATNNNDKQQTSSMLKKPLDNIDHLPPLAISTIHNSNNNLSPEISSEAAHFAEINQLKQLNTLGPLESKSLGLLNSGNGYVMMFNLQTPQKSNITNNNDSTASTVIAGCPLDNDSQFNVSLPRFDATDADNRSKLLYIHQGNYGSINHTVFDDSIVLPKAGYARVKIIMDIMGIVRSNMGNISILAANDNDASLSKTGKQTFQIQTMKDTILSTEYLDIEAHNNKDFVLLFPNSIKQEPVHIKLEPGSRNLVLVHEYEPKKFTIKLQQLQDNKYMISVLWQLIPYVGISAGELMFSITGLEFSYSVAPKSMKSMILGAWLLTTAFGNLLTVAVESLHIFTSVVMEFYFYGTLMILDMVIFAWIAYFFDVPNPGAENPKSIESQINDSPSQPSTRRLINNDQVQIDSDASSKDLDVISKKNQSNNNNIGDSSTAKVKPESIEREVVVKPDELQSRDKQEDETISQSPNDVQDTSDNDVSALSQSAKVSKVPNFSAELENYGKAVDESPQIK